MGKDMTAQLNSGKRLVAGILAHVDSGKTTLSEALLYTCGAIRKAGRVDHGDAFLDTDPLEKKRGITIFSKEAVLKWKDTEVTLLDTPGHRDFAGETERVLSVLDFAILVVSGSEGIQSHTETLWNLLKRRNIPVLVFVNKMDISFKTREELLEEMEKVLKGNFTDMTGISLHEESGDQLEPEDSEAIAEKLAMASERLTELALEDEERDFTRGQWQQAISEALMSRQLFPVVFGSALKMENPEGLLDLIQLYCTEKVAATGERGPMAPFGGRVFKISRDSRGARLTFMRITSGQLHVRDQVQKSVDNGVDSTFSGNPGSEGSGAGSPASEKGRESEKISQIRIYSGEKYTTPESAAAGQIVAVTGLSDTYAGQGLGIEADDDMEVLQPFMDYVIRPVPGQQVDEHRLMGDIKALAEEDPKLDPCWQEEGQEIHVSLMGEIQLEVLKELIRSRYGYEIQSGAGRILYREKAASIAEGVGHFEPLRHYAEVHLVLEPGEPGSGLVVRRACSTDELDLNWQRLIVTHLEEKVHRGVLTGAPLTDTVITVVGGKAHKKHTEGGDFRQATYRALRCGLMKGGCLLLEPWMDVEIRVPSGETGRVMTDLIRKGGTGIEPENSGDMSVIRGKAPASELIGYPQEILRISGGKGSAQLRFAGYEPCHDQERVVEESGYDPEKDLKETADSVFCSHGSGDIVSWRDVEEYMAVPSRIWDYLDPEQLPEGVQVCDSDLMKLKRVSEELNREMGGDSSRKNRKKSNTVGLMSADDRELMEIFQKTYGPLKEDPLTAPGRNLRKKEEGRRDFYRKSAALDAAVTKGIYGSGRGREICILGDGYNIMNAWPELKKLMEVDYGAAREDLISTLQEYQGYTGYRVILVFDAYKVRGGLGSTERYEGLEVVYTSENETADAYIQRVSEKLARKYDLWVISSDLLIQQYSFGHGALRMSSMSFLEEVTRIKAEIRVAVDRINEESLEY